MTVATVFPTQNLVGSASITAGTTQTQAGATAIAAQAVFVTTGNANDGIILPKGAPGQVVLIQNLSAVALKLYPPLTGAINGGTVNAAVALTASKWSTVVYTTEVNAAAVVA